MAVTNDKDFINMTPHDEQPMAEVYERYWGIYCPQCNVWQERMDGTFYHYPSPAIAQAHIDSERAYPKRSHLWEVTEFGKQVHTPPVALPPQSAVCPGSYIYHG
jgi:hypothetical protein